MGKLVGSSVQFTVSELLIIERNRDRAWLAFRLAFEQLVNSLVRGIHLPSVIPLGE